MDDCRQSVSCTQVMPLYCGLWQHQKLLCMSVCLGVYEYFEGEGREGRLQYQTKTEKIVRTQTQ